MSLESVIAELTAAVSTNNDLLRQVLAADEAKGGDAGEGAKRTRRKAADKSTDKPDDADTGETKTETKSDTKAVTFDALKDALGKWLGEFAKKADKENPEGAHPEVKARKAALKKTLEQLGAKLLTDIKDDGDKLTRLWKWLHEKAIPVDKGFGIGRLAEDPKEEDASDEDDGLGDL